jgi:hypothetical protein
MSPRWVRPLFVIAAVYDGVLGLVFLFAPTWPFAMYGVPPPNHVGYVQFPALLLLVFAVMFLRIAADPPGRRELILYGSGLKVSYCATVGFHELTAGIPSMWIPWAWADLVFLALFVLAGFQLRARS